MLYISFPYDGVNDRNDRVVRQFGDPNPSFLVSSSDYFLKIKDCSDG